MDGPGAGIQNEPDPLRAANSAAAPRFLKEFPAGQQEKPAPSKTEAPSARRRANAALARRRRRCCFRRSGPPKIRPPGRPDLSRIRNRPQCGPGEALRSPGNEHVVPDAGHEDDPVRRRARRPRPGLAPSPAAMANAPPRTVSPGLGDGPFEDMSVLELPRR